VKQVYCLSQLEPGQKATIKKFMAAENIQRRLLDIGLIEDTEVECLGRSPGGDPSAYMIRGAVIAIRSQDCCGIQIDIKEVPYGID